MDGFSTIAAGCTASSSPPYGCLSQYDSLSGPCASSNGELRPQHHELRHRLRYLGSHLHLSPGAVVGRSHDPRVGIYKRAVHREQSSSDSGNHCWARVGLRFGRHRRVDEGRWEYGSVPSCVPDLTGNMGSLDDLDRAEGLLRADDLRPAGLGGPLMEDLRRSLQRVERRFGLRMDDLPELFFECSGGAQKASFVSSVNLSTGGFARGPSSRPISPTGRFQPSRSSHLRLLFRPTSRTPCRPATTGSEASSEPSRRTHRFGQRPPSS